LVASVTDKERIEILEAAVERLQKAFLEIAEKFDEHEKRLNDHHEAHYMHKDQIKNLTDFVQKVIIEACNDLNERQKATEQFLTMPPSRPKTH